MTTQEYTETRQPTRRTGWLVAIVIIVVAAVAAIVWVMSSRGPVTAGDATIEITYTDDGTSYAGDREIIEGTVTVTFVNETTTTPAIAVWGYETGSDPLAQELAWLEEGNKGVPIASTPVAGYFDLDFDDPADLVPGSHTWTMDLKPGTYLFDVLPDNFMTTGLWRAAVIEVVAK